MDITPDLSHLTADERKIIEAVIQRQKLEEHIDGSSRRSTTNDYSYPNVTTSAGHRSSQSNVESGVVCQLCQKTKFVQNQSSRQCYVCHRRFCIRCGIRLKNQTYLCHQCREKQEIYFSSKKQQQQLPKQYLSDYILTQTQDATTVKKTDQEDISSPDSTMADERPHRKLPEIQLDPRSSKLLKDFRYHSLEERESGQDPTLKDSGIDTASSSTILNVIPADPFRKSITNWRWNESRTEQMGYIYLKNPLPISENDQDQIDCDDLFHALGLFIDATMNTSSSQSIAEIIRITRGSLADTYGQLRVGDQVLEWNGDKLVNLSSKEICRIIARNSLQSPHIQLIVRRVFNPSTSTNPNPVPARKLPVGRSSTIQFQDKNSIQIQLSFQYDHKEFYIMIYGARSLPIQRSLLACQVSVQYENDSLSRDVKCTKAQLCSSSTCTWNQALRFAEIDTLEQLFFTVTLRNLDRHETDDSLGQVKIYPLNVNPKPDWYTLEETPSGVSVNRTHPSTTDISPPIVSTRKRQLPNIPTSQLHVNREKVSQELLEKATQLKLRLHLQSTTEKSLLTQHSFDHTVSMTKEMNKESVNISQRASRQSMVNLSTLKINAKDKPKIPIIRDKSTPNSVITRPGTTTGSARSSLDKNILNTVEEKYRKPMKNRDSSATTVDEVDSDGSELSTPSKMSSASMFSNQSDRPRLPRKTGFHSSTPHPHLYREDEIQLNEEELRQMAMRTHDTFTHPSMNQSSKVPASTSSNPTSPQPVSAPVTTTEVKTTKTDQRQDGTLSDSVLSSQPDSSKKRRPSMSSKALVILGLSKKANSASSLGMNKRTGFQRSEEIGVQPHLRNRTLARQTSKENETPTSAPASESTPSPFALSHQREQCHSIPHDMKLWSGSLNLPHERPFAEFIEELGPGQVVGRQVLASPCHGEIQVGLRIQQCLLEVEIVRARKLLKKALYTSPPASYVKVYLLDGKTCLEKQRTPVTRRTLDPLVQKTLIFKENYRGKILQISVWGDYGKLDRKVFMGVCQINLDEMNFDGSQQKLAWYKLFSANSLISTYTAVQTSTHRRTSVNSQDSS